MPPDSSRADTRSDAESDPSFTALLKRLAAPDAALLPTPQPGTQLGGRNGTRYEVKGRLGSGGMGTIYRAWDSELKRDVALKFLRQHTGLSERLKLFRREGPATAQLNHENVVRIHDVGEWVVPPGSPVPFLVMECLEGETLSERLKREPLELGAALQIMTGLAAGLAHVHQAGMVHRDLKPGNVFLTREGQVKLLDFGLAQLTSAQPDPDAPDRQTGTPAYMAPEQHRGEPQSACTDIWAAGLILYEMLAGQHPYPDAATSELAQQICSPEPVPSLRLHRSDLPEDVHRLLAATLAKPPWRRLSSADELLGRLRELEERLLPAQPPARELPPEHRQLTLLACALSLLPESDEEKTCEVLAAYQQACSRVVHRFGGTLSLCLSNEVLALFGYPRASDEDSLHAAFAALALQAEVGQQLQALAPGCALKIALHTGKVLLSAGPDGTTSVQGETPGLARELAGHAEGGAVLASDATQQLVRGVFKMRELGVRELSGLAGPKRVRVHLLLRERKMRLRFAQAIAAGGLTPLVGRDRELAGLRRNWDEARGGLGAAVLITGEPGVGKSRLCQELRRSLPPRSHLPVLLQCWSQVENSAFAPVIDFCNSYLGFASTDGPQERLSKLDRLLPELRLLPQEVQLLCAFLSLPLPEGSPVHALPRAERKEQTMKLLAKLLRREAGEAPTLVVVEDLHSADPSTLQLLDLLVDQLRDMPVLMLLTARPELPSPFKPRPWLHALTLERLGRDHSAALIQEVARGRPLAPEVLEVLESRAGGVPLFIEELTRSALAQQEESGALAELPSSLNELLSARLDRLPRPLKTLAVQCAVAGLSFSAAQIALVVGRDGAALLGELEELVDLGLLHRDEKASEPTYRFRHPLLQEAAYRSQPPAVRRDRHGRFAQMLQERFPELVEAQPELLAHHLTQAGAAQAAIRSWARAAELASRRSAYVEAASHISRALELLRPLPEPQRAGVPQELQLLIALGLVQTEYLGYSSATARTYARVLELLGRPGSAPPEVELSLWGPFSFYFARAEFESALQVAQRMVDLGQELHKPSFLALGHRMAATVLFTWGEMDRAQEEAGRALAHSRDEDVERHRAIAQRQVMAEKHWADPAVMALAYAAIIHSVMGRPDEARAASAEAVALAERIGHPFTLAYALTHTALACQTRHEAAEVVRFASRARALGREHRFLLWETWAGLAWSWGVSALGQPTVGIAQLRAALERWAASGLRAGMPHNLGMLADMHLRAGELEEGLEAIRQALEWAERTGERSYEVELHRLRGELLRRQEDEDGAHASFCRAIELARLQGAHGLGRRAAESLARGP